jgi:GrpB-like predicted nucleotidyltransferase (UPF0157 family)
MIDIVDYRVEWRETFADLKRVLVRTLGSLALGVEHVGSTAVPGLAAKPIIDLDVIIDSREALQRAIVALSELGYLHQGDIGVPGREAFGRESNDVPRDGSGRSWPAHHLYVCDKDNRELQRHLAFRDFLRAHSEYVEQYAQVKRSLARTHGEDRKAYTEGKTQFIAGIMGVIDGKNSA